MSERCRRPCIDDAKRHACTTPGFSPPSCTSMRHAPQAQSRSRPSIVAENLGPEPLVRGRRCGPLHRMPHAVPSCRMRMLPSPRRLRGAGEARAELVASCVDHAVFVGQSRVRVGSSRPATRGRACRDQQPGSQWTRAHGSSSPRRRSCRYQPAMRAGAAPARGSRCRHSRRARRGSAPRSSPRVRVPRRWPGATGRAAGRRGRRIRVPERAWACRAQDRGVPRARAGAGA